MQKSDRPNILVFMPDQMRPDWVGPRNRVGAITPNVDALAARGVNFSNAVCPSPLCGPSRASLATGLEYDRNPVPTNRFSMAESAPNFYRQMAHAGYQVLTCGKIDLLKGELDWGADGQHMQDGQSRLKQLGFTGGLDSAGKHATLMAYNAQKDEPFLSFLRQRRLEETHVSDMAKRRSDALGANPAPFPGAGANYVHTEPNGLPDEAYQDNWIGQCGLDLLDQAKDEDAPWFLQVNFVGPHEPVDITNSMADRTRDRIVPLPNDKGELSDEKHLAIRRNYTAMVENLDRVLGLYVDFLEKTGQLDNTVIIFTSDHGEMLGDAGLWEKSVPYQPSIGVPLIIAGPGVAKGATTDQPATILDLHATCIALSGAEPLPDVDSRSLLPVLSDPGYRLRDIVFSGLSSWRVAYDGRYKLVAGYSKQDTRQMTERGDFAGADPSRWKLVEPAVDPEEVNDLSASKPEILHTLREALIAQLPQALAEKMPPAP